MRPATYAFAAALLAATWQFSAANAQTPPARATAAAAMQRVASLKRDYLQQLEAASPDDRPRIAGEAGNALEKAVTDEGLSVEEYTTILEMAQTNPQVRQKIIERMQAPAPLD